MQSGPNSRFSRDFFAQNRVFVQDFVSVFYFLDGLTGKFGVGTRNSEPRNFFFGAWNFYFGARNFSSRLQDFGVGLPQKAKIPHKILHKEAVLCKKCLFFSLFCLAISKAASRKSAQIRQKETCSALGVTFCQTRVSSDTVPGSAATDLKSGAIGPSGGKTPPPCRGGGPQGRRGFPCTRVISPFFRPVYVVRGCVPCCIPVGVSPPPPLRGSSPCEARSLRPRAEFIKSPSNFYCPKLSFRNAPFYSARSTNELYQNKKRNPFFPIHVLQP